MIFSKRDIDILRLIYWCQFVLPDDLSDICSDIELHNLLQLVLIKIHQKSGALVLTNSGGSLLKRIYGDELPNLSLSYRENLIRRRLRLSRLVLTAYRAGVQVFTQTTDDLTETQTLFLPAVTRGRGHNPWGNTRTAAILHLGDLSCAAHYVCPGIGKLMLLDELTAFSNNTAHLKGVRQALIFAGDSYGDVIRELESSSTELNSGLISYGDAYRKLSMPIHLLSCDHTGAQQLRIMSVPGYREKLTRAALKAQFEPPPKDVPHWDGIYKGVPFVMAADMDLRRVDAAITTAKERGCAQIALAALEEQTRAVFFSRYRDTCLARVFTLTDAALTESGCSGTDLRASSDRQFLTAKGDVVDAPLIQTRRKTGRYGPAPLWEMG